jgi:hypothetical protein
MYSQNALKLCVVALGAAALMGACRRHTVVVDRAPQQVVVQEPAKKVVVKEPADTVVVRPAPTRDVIVTEPAPVANRVVVVKPIDPPPAKVEVRTVAPAPDYIWVPGEYQFVDGQWEWQPGRWMMPVRTGATWEPGHWMKVDGGYMWQPGGWR